MADHITDTVKVQDPAVLGDQRWYGRLRAIDEQSKRPQYAMPSPRSDRYYRNWLSPRWRNWPKVLNQGATSRCVAFSSNKFLLSHRMVNQPLYPEDLERSCQELYDRCQKIDEWPGENYDGTSLNAAMKVFREDGFIDKWTWAYEVEPVVRHILEIGPVLFGTDWTFDMDDLDSKGYIWPTGLVAGGHAYLIVACNRFRKNPDGTQGALRILNSWGADWGQQGRAWLSFDSAAKLLKGLEGWSGEAAAPSEIKRAA